MIGPPKILYVFRLSFGMRGGSQSPGLSDFASNASASNSPKLSDFQDEPSPTVAKVVKPLAATTFSSPTKSQPTVRQSLFGSPDPKTSRFATPKRAVRHRIWNKCSGKKHGFSPVPATSQARASPAQTVCDNLDYCIEEPDPAQSRPAYFLRGSHFQKGQTNQLCWKCPH